MLADSPWFVGFNLICGLDNAFILGYSFLIMSFLGWAAGSVLFIVGMCICFYCNCVTGSLHTLGGHRNIHFRDLARTGFGKHSFCELLKKWTCSSFPLCMRLPDCTNVAALLNSQFLQRSAGQTDLSTTSNFQLLE